MPDILKSMSPKRLEPSGLNYFTSQFSLGYSVRRFHGKVQRLYAIYIWDLLFSWILRNV